MIYLVCKEDLKQSIKNYVDLDFLVAALQRFCVEVYLLFWCKVNYLQANSGPSQALIYNSGYKVQELQPHAPWKVLEFGEQN